MGVNYRFEAETKAAGRLFLGEWLFLTTIFTGDHSQGRLPTDNLLVASKISRAARECWMRTEKTSARENLDKRADLVNKCIEDKMR